MRRSRSGKRDKVQRARAIVNEALGETARRDGPHTTSSYLPVTKPAEPVSVKSGAIGVLTVGEVATRLNMSRTEVERLIERGAVKSLLAGWTTVIPTSEVERLTRAS